MSTLEELEGGSVWDEEVYGAFRAHVEEEDRLLRQYRRLAADSSSPDVAYLVELILEDEERHHRIFEQLAETVRDVVELEPAQRGVPDIPLRREQSRRLREAIAPLLRFERDECRRMRRLRRSLRPVQETTIWPLLVKTMELDTKKHILILEHILAISKGVFPD
jgi:hypothetical protein